MKTLCALLLTATAFSFAQETRPVRTTAYKVELRIRDSDDQRPNATRLYSFVLDDGMKGGVRAGKKVHLGDRNYVDVGVNIDARVQERLNDNVVLADIDLDISAMEGGSIQQMKWHGISRVTPGKPMVISSLQDPVLQKRLDVEITVTRVP